MAGIKISALPAAPSSQLTDLVPAVQAGVTVKETLSQIITLFNANIQLASTAQVTGLNAALASFLPLAGGTMAGTLILNTNTPTTALEAASKGYVDTVAGGFTVILAADAASIADVPSTQAGAGVGATLTDNSGTFAVFSIDGVSPALNSRILIKNQTASQNNGVYVLTTQGDTVSVPWQLTRATDYDQPAEIQPGTLVAVNTGTVNATTSWLETATVVTVDTDPVLFSQFTFAPTAFFQIANNLSEGVPATMRTNLGLGTVATKAASDAAKTTAVMADAATTIGNIAIFTDVSGTIGDGGVSPLVTLNNFCDGRMTLASGTPVTTVDVTAATTIYFTPYKGNQISLFDGASVWTTFTFSELSIAVPGTASTMYDLFVYDNTGTPTLETQTWTNDTTRAVGIILQDGVYVKSGATTRRYVGSFRTTTVNGQTEDSYAKRYVWNYYNRVEKGMKVVESTNSWTYSTAAFRQANASAANQLDYVQGVSEDIIHAQVLGAMTSTVASLSNVPVGIGLDSTTVNSATTFGGACVVSSVLDFAHANFDSYVAAGRHTIVWLEYGGGGGGVRTWYGDNGVATVQTGIQGTLLS